MTGLLVLIIIIQLVGMIENHNECYDRRTLPLDFKNGSPHKLILCKLDRNSSRYQQLTIVTPSGDFVFNRTEAEGLRYYLLWCGKRNMRCQNSVSVAGCSKAIRWKSITTCFKGDGEVIGATLGATKLSLNEVRTLEEMIIYWF